MAVTLLTEAVEAPINGHDVLYHTVRGLEIGDTILRAAGVKPDVPDNEFLFTSVPYEVKDNDPERLHRLAEFFMSTQVNRDVTGYNDNTFVSYIMGWSGQMNRSNLRNTGTSGTMQPGRAIPGWPLGIVKKTDNPFSLSSIRGSLKLAVLGIDGSAHVLTVPGENRPLAVLRLSDALKCFGGNALFSLRKP